jgi:hypothetical protein
LRPAALADRRVSRPSISGLHNSLPQQFIHLGAPLGKLRARISAAWHHQARDQDIQLRDFEQRALVTVAAGDLYRPANVLACTSEVALTVVGKREAGQKLTGFMTLGVG